jgi:ribosomal protein L2
MPVKSYKPYTPSRRFMVGYDFSDLLPTNLKNLLQHLLEELEEEITREE